MDTQRTGNGVVKVDAREDTDTGLAAAGLSLDAAGVLGLLGVPAAGDGVGPGPVEQLRDLSLASRGCYEALATPENDFGFEKSGTLMLCRTQHALAEDEEQHAQEQDAGRREHDLRHVAPQA